MQKDPRDCGSGWQTNRETLGARFPAGVDTIIYGRDEFLGN
jgi:hypothetical protein